MAATSAASRALLLAVLALVAVTSRAESWKAGRATFFGTDYWTIHEGACGYGYQYPNVGTGWDVTALSDADPAFPGSCGRCYEVRCKPSTVQDGYGASFDRSSSCRDPSQTVVVRTVDNCPCWKPDNAYSNKRWCCNDHFHMDLSIWAFEKLAINTLGDGVIGIEARPVPCSYKPSNPAPAPANPSKGQDPPQGAKIPDSSTIFVKRFDSAGATQGAVKQVSDPSQAGGAPQVPFDTFFQGGFPGSGGSSASASASSSSSSSSSASASANSSSGSSSSGGDSLKIDTSNGCTDTAPSDGVTCAQRKAWGACSANWILKGNYCRATCGRCTPSGNAAAAPSSPRQEQQQQQQQPTWTQAFSGPSEPSDGSCSDVQVPNEADCATQKAWGKCDWDTLKNKNYCAATCGRCGQPSASSSQSSGAQCYDTPTPDGNSCDKQKAWGKCSEGWMKSNKYCQKTCGAC